MLEDAYRFPDTIPERQIKDGGVPISIDTCTHRKADIKQARQSQPAFPQTGPVKMQEKRTQNNAF